MNSELEDEKIMMDWTCYSHSYDLMAENNPAYQEILDCYAKTISQLNLNTSSVVADIGGGTGNFSIMTAKVYPDCRVLYYDFNSTMLRFAKDKAVKEGIRNIEFGIHDFDLCPSNSQKFSLIVCIHSIYTMKNPLSLIKLIYEMLSPGGHVFACDLGRTLNIMDWTKYIFSSLRGTHGMVHALKILLKGREVARANYDISKLQKSGQFWLHELDDFIYAFTNCGFEIGEAKKMYRGYSDLVFAQKPMLKGN